MKFVKKILGTIPTTAGVMSKFRAAIGELEAVAEHHMNKADHHQTEAATHNALAGAARDEAHEAMMAASKLQAVFG